jgi:hypothetical protein
MPALRSRLGSRHCAEVAASCGERGAVVTQLFNLVPAPPCPLVHLSTGHLALGAHHFPQRKTLARADLVLRRLLE